MNKHGKLYLVSTPIGNLGDITLRALEVLKAVDVIAAEDTRHSSRLLQHFAIKTPCVSLYEDNEKQRSQQLIERLMGGESVAVISDAGTPLISDPGYFLVNAVREAGIDVITVPGPCAAIAALSASGLSSDRFTFEGFLPNKGKAREQCLQQLQAESRTMIFYESVHRISAFIRSLNKVFGGAREAAIARELTKQYEEIKRASLAELLVWLESDDSVIKGEFVVLVAGCEENVESEDFMSVLQPLLAELSLKQSVALTTQITGVSRKIVYEAALRLKKKPEHDL